jgi:Tat protein translocase TatB subunit
MFDIGFQEMLLIGVLALLVFGPSRLPELGRMVGRAMREFRRASDEFRSTVETNLNLNEPYATPAASPTPEADAATPTLDASDSALPSETEASVASSDDAGTTNPAVPAAPVGEPFCAQRGSRLFHRRECDWVTRIPASDRVEFPSVAVARDRGFATCPVCEPWEPG